MAHTTQAPEGQRLSGDEYFALARAGQLEADDRVELLEGVLVAMSPQNLPHAAALRRTDAALRNALGPDVPVSTQCPLVLGEHSVPEPDIAVLPGRIEDYDSAHPTSALLVIEIADASLAQDRITKGHIYAAAGIPEFWIVNLRQRRIEVFREPRTTTGQYASTHTVQPGGQLEPVAFPGRTISVSDLLPTADPVPSA